MKKLIFVLILLFSIDIIHRLLLLLPFTWFKSEVKDTVVEPVVIVEKKQIKGFKSEVKDTVVESVVQVEKRQTGVLFERKVNGILGWNEYGNKDYHAMYEGEIVNGQPNGQGKWTLPNGNKYEGEWKDGKCDGQGTKNWSNGGKYKGEWKDGEYHGQGTITYGKGKWKGDKYIGEFNGGKRDGQGTYTWSDGGKYGGEWKDGRPNGKGTWTYSSGWKYSGEMKNGEKWNGTTYDKEGKVVGNWVNGVEKKIP